MSGRRQKQLRRLAKLRAGHLPEYDTERVDAKIVNVINPEWKPGDAKEKQILRTEARQTIMLADCERRVVKDMKRALRQLKSGGAA